MALARAGVADANGDYKEKHGYVWLNAKAGVSLNSTVAENGSVSGTKVESSASGNHYNEATPPTVQPTDIVGAEVQSVKLTITGPGGTATETITKPTGPPPPGPKPAEQWPRTLGIRWASTRFQNGDSVQVTAEVTFGLIQHQHLSTATVTSTATIASTRTVQVYNKVLAWKTTKTISGNDWSPAEMAIINDVVTHGKAAYDGAKYGYVSIPETTGPPATGPDLIESTQVINGVFNGTATSLFGMTHGYSSAIQDSYNGNPLSFIGRWNLVAHPNKYAINVFYSCETMVTRQADEMPYQHGTPPGLNQSGQWIAAGRVGFRVTVYPHMLHDDGITPTGHTLAEHADKFFQALNEGYTLDKARRIANQFVFGAEKPTIMQYGTSSMMLISPISNKSYSDPYATLRYVYLGQGTLSNPDAADTRWYYVLP